MPSRFLKYLACLNWLIFYGIDPDDSNIRIAPSYPDVDELKKAVELLCICVKLAAAEKLTEE